MGPFRKLFSASRLAAKGKVNRHRDFQSEAFEIRRLEPWHEVISNGESLAKLRGAVKVKGATSGSCIIVGSGPSIKDLEPAIFERFDAITLNGSIRWFLDHGYVAKHLVITDRTAVDMHFDYLTRALAEEVNCFLTPRGIHALYQRAALCLKSKTLFLIEAIDRKYDAPRPSVDAFFQQYRGMPGIFLSPEYKSRRGTVGFNYRQDVGFFTSRTVAVWALQLACYLGYTTIYLAGMEMGATGPGRFYGTHKQFKNRLKDNFYPDISECLKLARVASNVHGFKLYNLTPTSLISADVIPRLTPAQALSQSADSVAVWA